VPSAESKKVPLSYILRNLWTRRLTTLLTAGGMALVVFVFATVLMLEEGLRNTLVQTGSWDNAVVIRRSAGAEVQSVIDRDQAAVVATAPEIAYGGDGEPVVSKEVVVLINLEKRGSAKPSNVVIRGVGDKGLALRPQVELVAGRMFRPGSSEIVAGRAIAERFSGAGLNETLRFGGREWTVVGVFDAGGTGFDSEIWGDAEQLMQAFRRNAYSVTVAKLVAADRLDAFKARLESDPRLTLEAKRETVFYAEQSEVLANFIRILGLSLSVIFSLGAIIGAMITMYAAVSNRTAEIGTLRALGFRRRSILAAFLLESLFLSLFGGVLGLGLASLMQLVSVSTMNWQSFSEIAFRFSLTPRIVVQSLAFAAVMGLLGGVLPAARAAGLKIVDALRAA
jgi:ABC-type antimicrobial peptide transport system permease subunit